MTDACTVLAHNHWEAFVVADDSGVRLVRLATGTVTPIEADELLTVLEFDDGWEPVGEESQFSLQHVINLPMKSEVMYPGLIGGPPKKPKRPKRKPKKFEASLLSLAEIPVTLDAAVAQLAPTPAELEEYGVGLSLNLRLLATMREVAQFGAHEVLRELVRQGAPTGLLAQTQTVDVDARAGTMHADWEHTLSLARDEVDARLARKRLSAARRAELQRELVDLRTPGLLKRFLNRAVNEAFAFGRHQAMRAFRTDAPAGVTSLAAQVTVDAVVMTSVLDLSTCDPCFDVDGEVMEFGSARQDELHPPYVKCLGGDACRCIQIALMSDGSELEVDEVEEDDTY